MDGDRICRRCVCSACKCSPYNGDLHSCSANSCSICDSANYYALQSCSDFIPIDTEHVEDLRL